MTQMTPVNRGASGSEVRGTVHSVTTSKFFMRSRFETTLTSLDEDIFVR